MKYIDAEDLQVIIEKRINNIESCPFIEAEFGAEMRREGKILAYNDILALIDSLQQEQPDKETILRICKLHKAWSIMAPWENVEDFVMTNWNSENIV